MYTLKSFAAFFLAPVATLALPSDASTSLLNERATCGVEASVTYYRGDNCEENTRLATINWKNDWSNFNYNLPSARSFAITGGDYWDIYCSLYSGDNGGGNSLATLEWNTGYRICKPLGSNGGNVRSFQCWGNGC
ncbi:hypothetical protein BDV12DRAFT_202086 [Aspergillus spectabilis]